MRHSSKRIFALALLAALVAGCSTVTVAPTAPPAEAPQDTSLRHAHWRFDDAARPPAERDGYRRPRERPGGTECVSQSVSGGGACHYRKNSHDYRQNEQM